MKIADENGIIYEVLEPEQIGDVLDNDQLLAVLKSTHLTNRLHQVFDDMVDSGVLEKVDEPVESPREGMTEGVEFLSKLITERLGAEKVQDVFKDVESIMANRHGE